MTSCWRVAIAGGKLGAILQQIIDEYLLDAKLPLGTLVGVVWILPVIDAILCYIAGLNMISTSLGATPE